jgi:hypothetical protein
MMMTDPSGKTRVILADIILPDKREKSEPSHHHLPAREKDLDCHHLRHAWHSFATLTMKLCALSSKRIAKNELKNGGE